MTIEFRPDGTAIAHDGSGHGAPGGTYVGKDGAPKFKFKPGGKVKFFDMQGRGAMLDFDGDRCLVSQVFGRLCKP